MSTALSPPSKSTRVSELNQRFSSRSLIRLLAFFVFLGAFITYIVPDAIRGELGAPPSTNDGRDYDAIAFQLSRGLGFSYNWDDPEFKKPYLAHNESGKYDYLLKRHGEGATAYRPPLLPALMAASYGVFGRQFGPIRVLTSLCIALACVMAFIMVSSRFGVFPGLLCASWFLIDPRLRAYATRILTEAPACLVITAMCWLLLRTVKLRSWKAALGLGAVTGIAFLARTVFFLWLPIVAAALYALAKPRATPWLSRSALCLPAVFLVSFAAVSAPWMARNCLVLGAFEPLGTMGSINLSAAYSTKALERRGVWFNLSRAGFFDQLQTEGRSLLEQEKIQAEHSRQQAIRWLLQNPSKVPLLFSYKIVEEWKPRRPAEIALLAYAVLGCLYLFSRRPREALSLLALLVACTLAVAVTWTVRGRFLLPVLPILAMLAGLGAWCLILASLNLAVGRLQMATHSAASSDEKQRDVDGSLQ